MRLQALGLLTVSAFLPYSVCEDTADATSCSPPQYQIILFFFSLSARHLPREDTALVSSFLELYHDNLSWALGFGIPCIVMGLALLIFAAGTVTYRFGEKVNEKSPFLRIGQVFVRAFQNRKTRSSSISLEEEASGTLPHQGSQQFRFLNKALLSPDGSKEDGKVCSINEVEEAKAVLRLVPIWASCLGFAVVFAQFSTLFTKQGVTMDRSIGSNFEIPAATLQSFISMTVVILIPIYDRIMVPIVRSFTRKPSGLTMLQRIGTGISISILSMAVSALVEIKRLQTAEKYGLVDDPNATIPMKVWWLLPQYLLTGVADVFTMVGLQEFFYDQVPTELRSIGLALYLSIFGVGSFISSFLISVVEKTTGGDGKDGWISDNLNRGHLDYFYWLLAGFGLSDNIFTVK
ncbi:NRT1/ PTR family 5.10-like protein [Tanacetum coccineum]